MLVGAAGLAGFGGMSEGLPPRAPRHRPRGRGKSSVLIVSRNQKNARRATRFRCRARTIGANAAAYAPAPTRAGRPPRQGPRPDTDARGLKILVTRDRVGHNP